MVTQSKLKGKVIDKAEGEVDLESGEKLEADLKKPSKPSANSSAGFIDKVEKRQKQSVELRPEMLETKIFNNREESIAFQQVTRNKDGSISPAGRIVATHGRDYPLEVTVLKPKYAEILDGMRGKKDKKI